jgi:tripartite-type tricarboxylate transporter receptor subunit TctC
MLKLGRLLGATALATLAMATTALAEYPEKPVEFVVPWPPGDLEDVLTRMIAEDFQAKYGVPAAVVNKPGGGGGPFPGAIEVANAPAATQSGPSSLPCRLSARRSVFRN